MGAGRGGVAMTKMTAVLLGLAAVLSLLAHDGAMAVGSPGATSSQVMIRSAPAPDHAVHDGHGDLALIAEVEARTCGTSELSPPPALAGIDSGSAVLSAIWSCDGLLHRRQVSSFLTPTTSPGVRRALLQVYLN